MSLCSNRILLCILLALPFWSGFIQASDGEVRSGPSEPERALNISPPSFPVQPGLPALPVNPDLSNLPPNAQFIVAQPDVYAPATTLFSASTSTDDRGIEEYSWDFGDGAVGSGEVIQHEYLLPGNYLVSMTVTDTGGVNDSATTLVTISRDPLQQLSDAEAARFLTQATFGATVEALGEVQSLGLNAWIDQQQSVLGPPHVNYYTDVPHGYSFSNDLGRHEVWWLDAVRGQDQLRNRVAYALSQFFVTSDVTRPLSTSQVGMTRYYDLLRVHAFGNYRDLLGAVTLNPVMGVFLSMAGNERANIQNGVRPDENYAREILQLFSLGVYRLKIDGTELRDANNQPIPNYNENMVKEFARIFTGWDRPGLAFWQQISEDINSPNPMEQYPDYHDNQAKLLLFGQRVPAGQSPEADLEQALDNIFNHPNVAPFFCKQLIQRLVTSTPTAGYVERVARVFNNNGDGVRGDLAAVVRSILLDQEARFGHSSIEGYGKLREPLLRMTHVLRAFSVQPGYQSTHGQLNTPSPGVDRIETVYGQKVLGAPSVFNFYQPGYSPPGPIQQAGLVAPEFQIFTDNNILESTNRISRQIHSLSIGNGQPIPFASYLDLSEEVALAANPDALLDHLNVLLLSGGMTTSMTQILRSHLEALPDTPQGHFLRARDAINLIVTSPDYLIQM